MVEYKERIEKLKEYAYRIPDECYNIIIDTLELNAKSTEVQKFLKAVRYAYNESITTDYGFEFIDTIIDINITELKVGDLFIGSYFYRMYRHDDDECVTYEYSFNFDDDVHTLIVKTDENNIIFSIHYDNYKWR